MCKVCHITSAHTRYDIRIYSKECTTLANNNYEVILLVNDENDDEFINNIFIMSTKFISKNRLDRFMFSRKKLYLKALEVDADIYHLHDPDLLPLGNKLKLLGKKVIFDSHEDVPAQIKDKQWIPRIIRNIISNFYRMYEIYSIKNFDAVISVTPHIVDRFLKNNSNSVMITNFPIIEDMVNVERNTANSICFAGGISEQWNHDKVIIAIEKIQGIKYIIAGKSSKEYISYLEKLPAWDKVDYIGVVPHSEVKNIYDSSIAGMALNYSTQAKKEGTLGNTKLFEFMQAKLPIICSNYKLWKEIMEKYNCGICVDPHNVNEIKEAIEYYINNPQEAIKMGQNGRIAVEEKYNWKTQEVILLQLYKEIVLSK
ncbi:glycosyltransferase [Alkalibaculum sp. M08DMB]|uniref:Glycosyltransferase n=1 Tax=Alkalibaculum sporogenes TaxID=2655001 RepID=A0A6A7KCE3_9FIRM|nr:glycosyltransferase [Alkalibaculum sporogenes]MPW26971.1 glycosyltransferase [Alkalibaculum sporogenes]